MNTFNYFTFGFKLWDFKEKEKCLNKIGKYMLSRTQQMFKYNGLPDTIKKRDLELLVQTAGYACFVKEGDNVYALNGTLGGLPDQNNMPTECIIANPYLKLNKEYKIDENCVIMANDSLYQGLIPLISRYGTLMVENELSMKIATITKRAEFLLAAGDDSTKASAERFLTRIEKGDLGVIGNNTFLDSLETQPLLNNNNSLSNLIEMEQYLKAGLFNELGINSNYNMKRESLNSSESQLNDDMLKPLVDDMLEQRQIAIDKVNEMFGLNITVELSSAWRDNKIETALELDNIDMDSDQQELLDEEIQEETKENEQEETKENEQEKTDENEQEKTDETEENESKDEKEKK